MVITAAEFSPELMLSEPRRSNAIPNAQGTLAVYGVSRYSFSTHQKSSEIRVVDLKNGQSRALTEKLGVKDPAWAFDDQVLWLHAGKDGTTDLVVGWANDPNVEPMTVTSFDGPVWDLKVTILDEHTRALAVVGQATPQGVLFNPEKAQKSRSTARVHKSLYVRHWDTWTTENRNSIFYTTLKRAPDEKKVVSTLTTSSLANALPSRSPWLESPVTPFASSSDWDISKSGLVFVARNPYLNASIYMSSNIYHIPLKTFTEGSPPFPMEIKTGTFKGTSTGPTFSVDGKSIAFTRQRDAQYEADKARLFVVPDISDPSNVQEFFETDDGEGAWDVSVQDIIAWSADGKELYVAIEECGRKKLCKLPSSPSNASKIPIPLTQNGCVQHVEVLASGHLLLTSTSFLDSSTFVIIDPNESSCAERIVSSTSKSGKKYGLKPEQVSDVWFQGARGHDIQAWMIKPSNFDKDRKYPLAFICHGGPQVGLLDAWSTRWNLALFAEQGYIIFAPHFTGSPGFGFAFQNAIVNDWGGVPYRDLELAFAHLELHHPYVDCSRAVGMGGSYGGFMMNWIQGHPLGRKFKALVVHDGVMEMMNQAGTDELFFPAHDFGGLPWEVPENYRRWSPINHCKNWQTPALIVHSERDFRCLMAEAMAAFNVLQAKGIESHLLTFPDEGHWVVKPENSLAWYTEVLAWINKHTNNANGQMNAVHRGIVEMKI